MKLTPPQRLALGRLLKEKVGDFPACAACGNREGWSIGGDLVHAPSVEGEGGAGPFVTFSCSRCGHTLFFHARLLGLLEPA